MWIYEKRLEFPVNIKEPNAQMAQFIMSQYGGPDGEMGASMRYLSQRYTMPYKECKAALTDIGTEELAHLEIVAAIVPVSYTHLDVYKRQVYMCSPSFQAQISVTLST